MIVHSNDPITLVGGASLDRNDLNKTLTIAPRIVVADGGARHILANDPRPAAVIGDFDSLSDGARKTFGDILHHVPEQDTTDFEKVLNRVEAPLLIGLGFLGGRLDHSFSALNVLVRARAQKVILIGGEDLIFRLDQQLDLALPVETPIALLPMGPARAWTKGLRWDMDGLPLAPDGMVSSSNKIASEQVSLRVDGPVLISFPKRFLDVATNALLLE